MTTFLFALTSASNQSGLSALCLIHTCAHSVWPLFVLIFAYFAVIATVTLLHPLSVVEKTGPLKLEALTLCLFVSPPFSPGHVFNMPHDNVKACEEVFGKLKDNHMMSPTLIQIDRSRPWSVCSAAIITEFLDRGHGW